MGYKFNPFTGNLDEVGAGGAGSTPGGSDTQVQFNDGGSFGGSADLTWDDTAKELGVGGDVTLTGRFISSLNGAASEPPGAFTGTWFTGGTSTTTKPQFLIEPAGTTSAGWSTSGTGLGINAPSGFTGNLLDLQVDGTSEFKISNTGAVTASTLDMTPAGTNSPASVGFGTAASSVLAGFVGANRVSFTSSVFGIGFILPSDAGPIGFSSAVSTSPASVSSSKDTLIYRDAAGILAQRNGTNAQTYRLYNTYTDASNYERAYLRWASNVLEIGTEGAGTGSEKPVRITAATLKLPNLPTYADNAAATSGGLVAGDVYKTATGELRITV